VFKKETDPSKLGKALSESINKKTIIGTLLMLMILPLLSRSETDYSGHYAIREAFWFGRSSCTDPNGFFCKETGNSKWVTEEGWFEILRGLTRISQDDSHIKMKEVLWIYIPDFTKAGTIDTIKNVPNQNGEGYFWE